MNKLGIFVLFVLVATTLAGKIPESQRQGMKKWSHQCDQEVGSKISSETAEAYLRGEEVKDPTFPAHALCMSKKMKLQNDNGDLNSEELKGVWRTVLSPERCTKLEACLVQKSTPEHTALHINKCVYKAMQESLGK